MEERFASLTSRLTDLESRYEKSRGRFAFTLPDEETTLLETQIRADLSTFTEACKSLPKEDPFRLQLKTLATWLYDKVPLGPLPTGA